MKYNQPAGALPGAPYVDGNRNTGEKGSIVPAAAIEHPQRELAHLIEHAGLTPSATDLEQVRKAIEALIDAATGGGGSSTYILMSQARARLPIFPEIMTGDGRMNVTSPGAGTILVPEAVQFMHRGIFPVSTSDFDLADRTFATNANKTYHLRWNPVDGFALQDLADGAYNPDVKAESDAGFDSTYDDMLVARIVTDAGNVATITNLANRASLRAYVYETAEPELYSNNSWRADFSISLDWSRRPDFVAVASQVYAQQAATAYVQGGANRVIAESFTRYAISHSSMTDWNSTPAGFGSLVASIRGGAAA
ncbi:hypothetical protein [Oricola thermophila]|uniref:Uncharacterized protein n=1 Tax=Oricola thermophila TaxID=2742145 RepID=A0A6N1VLE9_9HYPH|nr:hypothetical protein [Oricola thermophila]QKV20232.1 hypothetical protein HTY61_18135 [Oricola thermophila]